MAKIWNTQWWEWCEDCIRFTMPNLKILSPPPCNGLCIEPPPLRVLSASFCDMDGCTFLVGLHATPLTSRSSGSRLHHSHSGMESALHVDAPLEGVCYTASTMFQDPRESGTECIICTRRGTLVCLCWKRACMYVHWRIKRERKLKSVKLLMQGRIARRKQSGQWRGEVYCLSPESRVLSTSRQSAYLEATILPLFCACTVDSGYVQSNRQNPHKMSPILRMQ